MMSDRPKAGIELNSVQVVASMAAAVTGAILTSYLGDGGTILGTAVGSGASTAGFAVYKHYLVRTKDKVAPVIVEHARQWTPTGSVATDQNPTRSDAVGRAGGPAAPDATRVDRAVGYPNGNGRTGNGQPVTHADWEQARRTAPGWAEPTRAETGWSPDATRQDIGRNRQDQLSADATRYDLPVTRQDAAPTRQDAAPTRTARYGTVQLGDGGGNGNGSTGSGGPGSGRHGRSGGLAGWLSSRPRWVLTVGSAAAVFIVVMVVITVIELGTGKPIAASVWGRHQTGTTLGGGSSTTATPSTTPTPTNSTTPTQSPTSQGVQQNQSTAPSGGASTGAPTPSSVPTVGATPTVRAPASVGASAPG
jgi:hypothetical protein